MWTVENRARYDRSGLLYPSDLTEEEWALARRDVPPAKRGGNKRTVDVREEMNGLMYVLRLPVARDPERPAAAEHGEPLFLPLVI